MEETKEEVSEKVSLKGEKACQGLKNWASVEEAKEESAGKVSLKQRNLRNS